MSPPLLRTEELTLTLPGPDGPRPILRGVSLDIGRGEMMGLVGESGSGKSMFARSLIRILPSGAALGGAAQLDGRSLLQAGERELRAIRAHEIGIVFQDPRAHVNPVRTIGDHLTQTLRHLRGVSRRTAEDRAVDLLEAVRIDRARQLLRRYPHELSGGMLQRVVIAGALAGEPSLLLADEPTTALDTTTQEEVVAVLSELCRERGLAVLFITHDLDLAAAVCAATTVMYAGRSVEVRASRELHDAPRHPYTAGLLASRPSLAAGSGPLQTIPGRPIAAHEAPPGCAFAPRCRFAEPACAEQEPAFARAGAGRVACRRADELASELRGAAPRERSHA